MIHIKFLSRYENNKGLVEQIHTEEDKSDCIAAYCQLMQANGKGEGNKCPYRDQINVVTLSYLDSRGPAFARALQSEVMQAEEFCMQVDSHSDVTQGLSLLFRIYLKLLVNP